MVVVAGLVEQVERPCSPGAGCRWRRRRCRSGRRAAAPGWRRSGRRAPAWRPSSGGGCRRRRGSGRGRRPAPGRPPPQPLGLLVDAHQAGHAVVGLAVHADLAGRPRLRGGPLDRRRRRRPARRARPSRGSRSSRRSRAGRPSRTCSRAPSAWRPRRSRGSGPTGRSTGRSGRSGRPRPVPRARPGPEWLKYGPIETITGVLASAGRSEGLRMSAWSFTPSVDSIVSSDQVAPGGTSAALAIGAPQSAATMVAPKKNRRRRQSKDIRLQFPHWACSSAGFDIRPVRARQHGIPRARSRSDEFRRAALSQWMRDGHRGPTAGSPAP